MKINTQFIKEKEDQFKQDLDYEEYLKYNTIEPSSNEIDNMEKVLQNPINILHYQPLKGA